MKRPALHMPREYRVLAGDLRAVPHFLGLGILQTYAFRLQYNVLSIPKVKIGDSSVSRLSSCRFLMNMKSNHDVYTQRRDNSISTHRSMLFLCPGLRGQNKVYELSMQQMRLHAGTTDTSTLHAVAIYTKA